MATMTAQILVGNSHKHSGGLIPLHQVWLSENDRPALVLQALSQAGEKPEVAGDVVWIPSGGNMLDDAMLLIGIHAIRDESLLEVARKCGLDPDAARLELGEVCTEEQREQLYRKCQEVLVGPKIIMSIFRDSSMEQHLGVLVDYKIDVEVCTPSYSRLFSAWKNETTTEGTLP